jgi:transposase
MEEFVGLDVSQKLTHLCVVDQEGKRLWQGACDSTPEAIAETIKARAPTAKRIGLESGPLSTWHWHSLKEMGLPVICLDARHAKAALQMQSNKTDKNDAHGLAQIVRTGWYREVSVKSMDNHRVRAVLGARAQLIGMRVDVSNQIKGVLKTFGIVLAGGKGLSFEERVEELSAGSDMFHETIRALLALYRKLKEQTAILDSRIQNYAKQSEACRHLMTIPGVGPITATAFVTGIDDLERFKKSRSVGAYFGLTPKRFQSGEVDKVGRITKWGDGLVRTYLFEAANALLIRVQKWSALKAWGIRLAKRSGFNKARVAVARKLAVIMHRMLVTGEPFRWSDSEVEVVPA